MKTHIKAVAITLLLLGGCAAIAFSDYFYHFMVLIIGGASLAVIYVLVLYAVEAYEEIRETKKNDVKARGET
jgi:hypothetical protein